MAVVIKSHSGRVGRQYPELGWYITSPNSTRLLEPLLGKQNICLCQNYLYSEHDPLLMPQPHNIHVPHLPLILNPSIPSEFGILWIVADLLKALEQTYTNIVLKIANTSSSSRPSARSDHNVQTYRRRFQYLSGYFKHTASSYSESLMAWSICQCICLELNARITWVQSVAPIWGKMDAWRVPVVHNVVGALTDNAEVAEKCFRSGIPVWLYHKLPVKPDIKVMQWHTNKIPVETVKGHIKQFVSFADADPPQPIIYTGNVMSLDRYSRMAENNNKIAFPGSAFDSIDPVTHPSMPPSIPAWVKACKQIGESFVQSQQPREGVPRGYILPEHGMLGSMDTKLRQKFLRMYLKLKPLLFYQIQKIGMVESLLSTSLWRKVLGMESLGVTNGTRAAETRQSLIHELQTTLMGSNLTINLNNLSSVVPTWKKEEI
ncbi:hypothetical protein GGU10DRAFT_337203 [Lentinula aff. detonsa]|uniref:Uncharacterized protein n=1 Tax=Lentinula aff. detonsa TaxID=2804958 RepID=A0AA38L2Q1_9AGAR|nr:hypothetical protein GGU10DRAFT_337203 [Lentinula aff. detonsa]